MRQRRLPFIKLASKIVRFPKAEVNAYLARHFHINARGNSFPEIILGGRLVQAAVEFASSLFIRLI
jgi:hypothetical protein